MKNRFTLIFSALIVLLGAMIWVLQDRKTESIPPALASAQSAEIVVQPTDARAILPTNTNAQPSAQPATPRVASDNSVVATSQDKTLPMVHVDPAGDVKYLAREGDTLSQLAVALLGSDTKENRDTIVASNPSLQTNPDRVLAGYTYVAVAVDSARAATPTSDDQTHAPPLEVVTEKPVEKVAEKTAPTTPAAKMKYIARAGDTVGILAANLLGGDTKTNRDAIIAENPSLQQDPDHLVAGQTYTIVATNGLAVDLNAPSADTSSTNALPPQHGADEAARLSVGRTLRYTAKSGDTVSRLAEVLLGSDTPANRELIIKSNPSLKQDPDHLVAGQTYWIAAPIADASE